MSRVLSVSLRPHPGSHSWFWQSWQTNFRVSSLLCSFSGIVVRSHLLQHSHSTHTELSASSVYIPRHIGRIVTVVLLSEEDATCCLCLQLLTVSLFLLALFCCFSFSLICFLASRSACLYSFSFSFSSLLLLRASAAACFSSCRFCFSSSLFLFLTSLCTHLSSFSSASLIFIIFLSSRICTICSPERCFGICAVP